MNGIVYSLFKNEGERVNQQDIFAKIGNANDFIIKLQIDEVDVTKVIPGQKIIISLDAYKKQVFTARITKVNPQKDIRNQSFEVEGVFIDAPPTLYSGLTGEGNIIINQRKDAMIIPLNFLMPGNKVKTKSGDIIVGTGLRNIDFIEITSGLDTNTILIKP
jgi:HlyD family secretion protein